MKRLYLRLKRTNDYSYPIFIGSNIFNEMLFNEIKRLSPTRISVLTDSNVLSIYSDFINSSLKENINSIISFIAGEDNKNLNTIQKLFSSLTKNKLDRKSLLVVIGGGVAGDMGGFFSLNIFKRHSIHTDSDKPSCYG